MASQLKQDVLKKLYPASSSSTAQPQPQAGPAGSLVDLSQQILGGKGTDRKKSNLDSIQKEDSVATWPSAATGSDDAAAVPAHSLGNHGEVTLVFELGHGAPCSTSPWAARTNQPWVESRGRRRSQKTILPSCWAPSSQEQSLARSWYTPTNCLCAE